MAYFVVERSGDGGVLSIPLPQAYETREAAIAALSAATASGEVVLTGEVFIADLGAAVPVLIMAAAPAASTTGMAAVPEAEPEVIAEEPLAEAGEAGLLEVAQADEAYTSWEPLEEISLEEDSLADALKRATTSLEDEGIVAPESIDSAPEPGDAGEAAALLEAAGIGEPPLGEVAAESDDAKSWPWANVESYEIKAGTLDAEDAVDSLDAAQVAEPASVTIDEAADSGLDDVGADTGPIITSAPPEGEEAYMPQPVILGDYGEGEPSGGVEESGKLDDLAVTAESEAAEQPDEIEELVTLEPTEEPEEPAESEPTEEPDEPAVSPVPVVLDELAVAEANVEGAEPEGGPSLDDILHSITATDSAPAAFETGYEPAGDLDLAGYTCEDCVYSNTCPKVGETAPAECGSFQWKSE